MNELSSYVFSSLREGDIALYRGSGNGLTPILLVAAEGTSPGLAKCAQIADPEVARFGQLSPTRLLKAQQAKIPHEKSKGLQAGSNASKRGLIIRGMLTPPDRLRAVLCSGPKMQRRAL